MNKEQQDLAWACLPKEARNHIRSDYEYYLKRYEAVNANTAKGAIDALEDLFGHHNLTSDTEPSELLFVERKTVQEYKAYIDSIINGDFSSEFKKGHCYGQQEALDRLFGDKCLPDKEPSVQVEPKFKVGDIVRVKYIPVYEGEIGIIDEIGSRILEYHLKGNKTLENDWFAESYLEPYTEPETTDNMEEKELGKEDNFPAKELNLAKLLIGCEGEEFFSPNYGEVILIGNEKYLEFRTESDSKLTSPLNIPTVTGYVGYYPSKEAFLKYPLDAKKAWMEWASERKSKYSLEIKFYPFKDGKMLMSESEEFELQVHSLEEAQQAAEAVRECLEKFHETHSKV